jgi:hypothetical protein
MKRVLDRLPPNPQLQEPPYRYDAVLGLRQPGDRAIEWAGFPSHMRPNPAQSIIRPGLDPSLVNDQRALRQLRHR